jgi:hypothetical protein
MSQAQRQSLVCDTCGKQVAQLRRDVVDADYNALSKPPLWNCDECYEAKRQSRREQSRRGKTESKA